MKNFFPVLIIFFIACTQPNERLENFTANEGRANQNVVSDKKEFDTLPAFDEDIYKDYIPQKLAAFLAKEMPDWKIPAPNKWDKYNFNEFKTANNLVNFISGDFNCDKRGDYALILEDKRERLAIWVFFAEKTGFNKIKLADAGSGREQIESGIAVLEPGEHGGDWNPKPVKIKCQAIEDIYFEKAAEAYYWENGKFKSIITSD